MKWWHPVRDNRIRKENALRRLVMDAIHDIRDRPVKVNVDHTVRRTIPRPSTAVVIIENDQGMRWQKGIDLSFKSAMPIDFPLSFITGRDEDIKRPPVRFMIHLEYDPKDRAG